jgi:hypothetical protein
MAELINNAGQGIVISIGDGCAAKPCIPGVSVRQFAP